MNKVAVIIHSHNDPRTDDCIRSAKLLTDDVVGVDFPVGSIVEEARNLGISRAKSEWVFLLDVDERMTPGLAEEIKKTLTADNAITHYKIPRKEIVFGKKWLKHGGWWPNYQIRLINKKFLVDWPKHIHSTPKIKGKCGFLSQPLIHYSQNSLEEIVDKTIIFEDKESDLLFQADKPVSTFILFRKFLGELWRRLLRDFGFLDGTVGIIESIYQAFSKTITYLFLYEKKFKSRSL